MADFEPCFKKVIGIEGGFNLHTAKGDTGGMTYAGIARKKWPEWEGWGKIDAGEFDATLTAMVRAFFKENFWDKIMGDDIGAQAVAYHIYAFAVNAGIKTSVKIAQRIAGVVPDGSFGNKTFKALNALIEDKKDEKLFVLLFSLMKIFRYKDICLHDKRRKDDKLVSNEKFLCGWINRVQEGIE